MADQMTPEQLQELAQAIEDLKNQFVTGKITQEQYNNAIKDLDVGIKGFSAGVKAGASMLEGLGKGVSAFGMAMLDGKQGYSAYNDSVKAMTNAAADAASQFGIVGMIIGKLIKAWGAYEAKVNETKDALFKANQDLAKTGLASGMTDVANNLRSFGYGLEEMGNMTRLLAENSRTLSFFGTTAETGAKRLGDIAKGIQNSDLQRQFMNMGMSVDDINHGIAGYIRQQTMLGTAQNKNNKDLAQGSAEYLKNMAMLSKLTGESAEALQKQQEEAMAEGAFYAKLEELPEQEKQLALQKYSLLAKYDKEGATAFAKTMAGISLGSQEQQNAMMKYGSNFIANMTDSSMGLKQFGEEATKGLQATKDYRRGQALLGQNNDYYRQQQFVAAGANGRLGEAIDDATKSIEAQAAGNDQAQAEAVDMRRTQMKVRDAAQDLIINGINPLTKAMGGLTSTVNKAAGNAPSSAPAATTKESKPTVGPTTSVTSDNTALNNKIIQVESGGRNIGTAGGTSTAYGVAQMTKGTFEGLAKQAKPGEALYGKSFEDMKKSEELQREALNILTNKNRAYLSKSGVATDDAAMYLAHFLGPGGAKRLLSQQDWQPIQGAVDPAQMAANKAVFKGMKTVGDLKAWAANKMGSASPSAPSSGYQKTDIASVQNNVPDAKEDSSAKMGEDITKSFEQYLAEQRKAQEELIALTRQGNNQRGKQIQLQAS